MLVKMILAAGDIPDESRVRKKTGEKWYTLRSEISIYGVPGGLRPQVIVIKTPGVKFLVSDEGTVNAVPDTSELVVEWTADHVVEFLQDFTSGD